MSVLKDILTVKWISGYRTKVIGGGMILSGVSLALANIGALMNGETPQHDWGAISVQIATGYGLLTAAAHKPKP